MVAVTIKLLRDADESYENINSALQAVRELHGSKTGDEGHKDIADDCTCELGQAIGELKRIRFELGMAKRGCR